MLEISKTYPETPGVKETFFGAGGSWTRDGCACQAFVYTDQRRGVLEPGYVGAEEFYGTKDGELVTDENEKNIPQPNGLWEKARRASTDQAAAQDVFDALPSLR